MGAKESKPADITIHNHIPASHPVGGTETAHNHPKSISQSSDGFSLVNFHWASFGTGFAILLLVVGVILGVVLCIFLSRKANKHRNERHDQLLKTISSSNAPFPGNPIPPPPGQHWVRGPMGFSAVPNFPPQDHDIEAYQAFQRSAAPRRFSFRRTRPSNMETELGPVPSAPGAHE